MQAAAEYQAQADGRGDELGRSLFMEQWAARLAEQSARLLAADFRTNLFTRLRSDGPFSVDKELVWSVLRQHGLAAPLLAPLRSFRSPRSAGSTRSGATSGASAGGVGAATPASTGRLSATPRSPPAAEGHHLALPRATPVVQQALLTAYRRLSVVH